MVLANVIAPYSARGAPSRDYPPENSYDVEDPFSPAPTRTAEAAPAAMTSYDGLMRIFWPADIPKSDFPGVIVGWKNSELDFFVVAVLDVADVSTPPPRGHRHASFR